MHASAHPHPHTRNPPTHMHMHTHTHTLHSIHLLYFQLTYIQFHFSTSFLSDHSHLLWIGFHLPPMPSAPHSSSSVDCSPASAGSVISAMLFASMWRSSPPVDSFSPCAKSCSASLAICPWPCPAVGGGMHPCLTHPLHIPCHHQIVSGLLACLHHALQHCSYVASSLLTFVNLC